MSDFKLSIIEFMKKYSMNVNFWIMPGQIHPIYPHFRTERRHHMLSPPVFEPIVVENRELTQLNQTFDGLSWVDSKIDSEISETLEV